MEKVLPLRQSHNPTVTITDEAAAAGEWPWWLGQPYRGQVSLLPFGERTPSFGAVSSPALSDLPMGGRWLTRPTHRPLVFISLNNPSAVDTRIAPVAAPKCKPFSMA